MCCEKNGVDLLEWEPGMGWEALCAFLGKKVPEQGVPHANERGQMTKVLNWRVMVGLKLWVKKVGLPTVGVAVGGLAFWSGAVASLLGSFAPLTGKS